MANGTFDPDLFMHQEQSQPNETKYTPIPEGEYANAWVETIVKPRQAGDNWVMDVVFNILDEDLRAVMNREKVTARLGVFLEFDASGSLAFGENQNVTLGRLREALGQNTGAPWSPKMMEGAGPVNLMITHRTDKNTGDVYDQVKRISEPRDVSATA